MFNRIRTFDALSNENFRHIFLGQMCTGMGLWMDHVARGWLVYSLTHSPLQLGLVMAIRGLPLLLFGLIAGVIADRYSRRIQLIIAAAINAIFSFILATLVLTGKIEVWHIYVTGFLGGISHAFQPPARMALINDLVGKQKLMNAVALSSAAFNVSRGVGPALAGFIITYLGVSGSYYAETVLYLVAVFLAARVKVPKEAVEALRKQAQTKASYYSSVAEAFKYVISNQLILALMILGLAPMFLGMPFTSLFPLFAVDILKVGATGQGLLLSSVGVGAFIGAMIIASIGGRPRGKLMLLGVTVFGLSLIFFSHSTWMWMSMSAALVIGIANTSFNSQTQTVIQTLAPDHMRGRVMSIYLIDRALKPLGTALAGVLAAFLGGPDAVMVMGISCLLLGFAVALLVPEVRALGSDKTTPNIAPKLIELN